MPQELIDLRYTTLNQRRFDKKKLIVEQRNKIMNEEEEQMRGMTSSLSHNMVNSSIANPVFNSTAKTPNANAGMFNTL